MLISPIIYVLFFLSIILQIVTLLLLLNRLKSIEELINKTNIILKEEIYQSIYEKSRLKSTLNLEKAMETSKKPLTSMDSQDLVKDNLEEDVIFMKQIKLNRGSQVIDMDVQVNNKNQ